MKPFVILLIMLSASLFATLLMIKSPKQTTNTSIDKQEETFDKSIDNNLGLIRRITKEADMNQVKLFQKNSIYLLDHMNMNRNYDKNFVDNYAMLNEIVNDTIRCIQTSRTSISAQILKTKKESRHFKKKIKSIGLAELNNSWHDMQKNNHQFLREPSNEKFQEYEENFNRAKTIITELYLEDEDEEYLFAYLDQHRHATAALYEVYTRVGLDRVREIKPLTYAIKEHMQLNRHLFKKTAL
jgi:hypothetical protein